MNKPCKFPECAGMVRTKDYCNAHYLQLNRGQTLRPLRSPAEHKTCSFDGCEKQKKGHGLCQGHLRQRTEGRELKPLRSVNFRSGRRMTGEGYVELFLPDYENSNKSGYILEHRYVMEQHLGRSLYGRENVHHKNGIRNDNNLSNLELWVKPQPPGQRVSDLLDWVVEHYPTELEQRILTNEQDY